MVSLFQDIEPHLKETLFITGSFVIAWSWDLLLFGVCHVAKEENPRMEQIGFGGNPLAPKYLPILLLEYVAVCGMAAWGSYVVRERFHCQPWCAAAMRAIEFIPAPFFSGKLMAYLGQFSGSLSDFHQGLLNLLATLFAAFLAHAAQDSQMVTYLQLHLLPKQLFRFRAVLAEALGFGLGVAWNVFLMQLLAPKEMDAKHIAGLFGYLLVVLLIAFRLAAMDNDQNHGEAATTGGVQEVAPPTLVQRTIGMMSFAANVVCAFTAVAFVRALLLDGWVGDGLCLLVLVVTAAVLSAAVATVQVDRRVRTSRERPPPQDLEQGQHQQQFGLGSNVAVDAFLFVPWVWCCCPWLPLLWILAGITPDLTVKERWQALIAFVLGLATSIQASGMLTNATNQIASEFNICAGVKYCQHPWLFLCLQFAMAIATTVVLLPALAYISPEAVPFDAIMVEEVPSSRERRSLWERIVRKLFPKKRSSSSTSSGSSSRQSSRQDTAERTGERRPLLLQKARNLIPTISWSSSDETTTCK